MKSILVEGAITIKPAPLTVAVPLSATTDVRPLSELPPVKITLPFVLFRFVLPATFRLPRAVMLRATATFKLRAVTLPPILTSPTVLLRLMLPVVLTVPASVTSAAAVAVRLPAVTLPSVALPLVAVIATLPLGALSVPPLVLTLPLIEPIVRLPADVMLPGATTSF